MISTTLNPTSMKTIRPGLRPLALAVAAGLLLAGCASAPPRAEAPALELPAARWSDAAAVPAASAAALPAWRDLVRDARLREVIALALEHNRDLRVALLGIEQARATYQVQDAARRPTLNATGSSSASFTPAEASSAGRDTLNRSYSVGVGISAWELDLFGRVASMRDSALQSWLNTEAVQRATRLTLIGDVATAWLTLGADRRQLALARRTLASQQDTLRLTERRQALGAASGLTLAQTRTTVETARGQVAVLESQVQRDRNALELLVGRAVPEVLLPTDADTDEAAALVGLPDALASTVLLRRPDVIAAEHLLQASRADLEAARAARFPRISLTASAGTASRQLGDLFAGGAWSFVPSVSWPILDGGTIEAGVARAEATRDIRRATYDKAVQTAFREVADALSVRAALAERLDAQRALVQAWSRSLTLAEARFRAGADSWLTVLDAQRSLYAAQQALITLELTEQSNRITLYKVLGGGGDADR
ncbi:outer membrane efflux protein [Sphaerotilus natans subsp. natans DSM 6575]|uniref:Outer membrane efflux protein n=1 Tax=Sphaerotilus natans subsp. natans DSM 6575 TaxID=1286631 RepID=A0A059KFP4_9BURK|nr:efflux transporter outer membrane subunit [Sphaerotilus natans]KDB50286.1 outer membrane efflux protein [Sphaerotilus natans subsp. natans DSM 6575]SIR80719.1 outer membrane protein, multidrug efflux system/outer membrane protein, multidrug efflux system [Sphaerotilus natans]